MSLSILTWIKSLRIQLQENSPTFNELCVFKNRVVKNRIRIVEFERKQIHVFSDVFNAVVVVVADGP